jgi:hypothetical protein
MCLLELENYIKDFPEVGCLPLVFLGGCRELDPPEIWSAYLQHEPGVILVYTPALAFWENRLKRGATAQESDGAGCTIYAERS